MRQGFSRKLFAVQNVAPGQNARVKVRKKDVVAYQVTTDVKVQEQRIRQNWIYPPEYYINAMILIEDKDIVMVSKPREFGGPPNFLSNSCKELL